MYELEPIKEPRKADWVLRIIMLILGIICVAFVVTIVFPSVQIPFKFGAFSASEDNSTCVYQAQSYRENIRPILAEWQDAAKLASNSPRISVAPQVANLQAIRRKMNDIKPGSCLAFANSNLITSMDDEIEGFLAFMAQNEQKQKDYFDESNRYFDVAIAQIKKAAGEP